MRSDSGNIIEGSFESHIMFPLYLPGPLSIWLKVTQSTLLLKKRKEMREVNDALEFMKEEFKTRIEVPS